MASRPAMILVVVWDVKTTPLGTFSGKLTYLSDSLFEKTLNSNIRVEGTASNPVRESRDPSVTTSSDYSRVCKLWLPVENLSRNGPSGCLGRKRRRNTQQKTPLSIFRGKINYFRLA